MTKPPLHPIQIAARRSGLNTELIRAWERRYQAIQPARAQNQQRLYRNEDIERLRLLARATEAGRRIGTIAKLSNDELRAMVEGDEAAAARAPAQSTTRPRTDAVMEYFDRCVEAIDALDPAQLSQTLNDAERDLVELFMQEDLIAPLIQHMQDECRHGSLRMAQKHMAEGVIRGHLLSYATRAEIRAAPRVVVAGGLAHTDELPPLRLAVATRAYGWQPVLLGNGLSADEIAYAAERARALCTAIEAPSSEDHLLPNELRKLRRAMPADHPLLLHGPSLALFEAAIEEAQVIPIQTFGELRLALGRILSETNLEQ